MNKKKLGIMTTPPTYKQPTYEPFMLGMTAKTSQLFRGQLLLSNHSTLASWPRTGQQMAALQEA